MMISMTITIMNLMTGHVTKMTKENVCPGMIKKTKHNQQIKMIILDVIVILTVVRNIKVMIKIQRVIKLKMIKHACTMVIKMMILQHQIEMMMMIKLVIKMKMMGQEDVTRPHSEIFKTTS